MGKVRLKMSDLGVAQTYKLLIGSIVPRPIALVSTISPDGVGNLAPFSFFNAVASSPASIMFSVSAKSTGGKKDTLINIEKTRQFVVNIVSHSMAEKMNQTSGEYAYGVDELEEVGFTSVPSELVAPRCVGESLIQMECELYGTMPVGDGSPGSATIVVGRILMMHVDERVYLDGKIKIDELQPLSRLAGFSYGLTSGIFDIPRPKL